MKKWLLTLGLMAMPFLAHADGIEINENMNPLQGYTWTANQTFNGYVVFGGSVTIGGGTSVIESTQTVLNFVVNSSTPLRLNTSSITVNTNDLVVEGSQVGIGTTDPTQKLTIRGTSGSAATSLLLVSSGTQVQMDMNATDSSGGFGYFGSNSNHPWLIRANSAEIARITADRGLWMNGGTSTPTAVASHAGIFAVTVGAATELKGIDSAGNVSAALTPHMGTPYWHFDSQNQFTNRHVRINVEKMLMAVKDGSRVSPDLMTVVYYGKPVSQKVDSAMDGANRALMLLGEKAALSPKLKMKLKTAQRLHKALLEYYIKILD
jgi:hypothetical protein